MLNSSIVISPLVLFCFQGRLIKQFGELITFFLPIQVPPRTGSLCDFTENSLHRPFRNESEYNEIKRKKFSNRIIVGKVAKNQTGFTEKEWGKFYLQVQINGEEKIIFKDRPAELALVFR